MTIEDLWYKHAIIYCLDVEKYMDADGDGIGDFEGLSRRLDYLAGLGVELLSNVVDREASGGGGLGFESVDELNSGNHVGQELGAV
jgi:maltose alpha-D-glucosyltransferase / alpha-amylase